MFSCKIFNTQKLKITNPYLKSCRYYLELPSAVGIAFVFSLQYGKTTSAAVTWIIAGRPGLGFGSYLSFDDVESVYACVAWRSSVFLYRHESEANVRTRPLTRKHATWFALGRSLCPLLLVVRSLIENHEELLYFESASQYLYIIIPSHYLQDFKVR